MKTVICSVSLFDMGLGLWHVWLGLHYNFTLHCLLWRQWLSCWFSFTLHPRGYFSFRGDFIIVLLHIVAELKLLLLLAAVADFYANCCLFCFFVSLCWSLGSDTFGWGCIMISLSIVISDWNCFGWGFGFPLTPTPRISTWPLFLCSCCAIACSLFTTTLHKWSKKLHANA